MCGEIDVVLAEHMDPWKEIMIGVCRGWIWDARENGRSRGGKEEETTRGVEDCFAYKSILFHR